MAIFFLLLLVYGLHALKILAINRLLIPIVGVLFSYFTWLELLRGTGIGGN